MKSVQSMINLFSNVLYAQFIFAVLFSGLVFADDSNKVGDEITAHQLLEVKTKQLMVVITEAQNYYEQDPDRFYTEIEKILDDVVDFNGFARGVMGKYANKKAYKKLTTKEEKQVFKSRIKRFSGTFRKGLVQTYAKGLLAFNGNKIVVVPAEENPENTSSDTSVTVVQHIYGEAPKPYVVRYKMRKDKHSQWKLRNLTIEAINLGLIYRSQFYSAAKRYESDIDMVIDNWSVDPTGRSASAG